MPDDLYLRRIEHPQARDNYRVILKLGDEEIEIGSIGIQDTTGAQWVWHWGFDTVIPMRGHETEGDGTDRTNCMRKFKAAWLRFASDEANLTSFLAAKRRAKPPWGRGG